MYMYAYTYLLVISVPRDRYNLSWQRYEANLQGDCSFCHQLLPEIVLPSLFCLLIRCFRFGCLPRWRLDLQLDKVFCFSRSRRFPFYSPVFCWIFAQCLFF